MKRIKKISILCLVLSFLLIFQLAFTKVTIVNASDEQETVLSDYAIRVGDLETTHLMGGVTLYKEKLKTIYNGINTGIYDVNKSGYTYSHNTVQWVDLPISSQDVKVVTWSKGTEDGWASSTVRTTALDYESKHPGWIVVAAVNGDGFDINGTKQPNNIHVQEGNVYQTNISPISIGWNDDNTPVWGNATLSDKMFVQVMNDGEVTKEVQVTSVNTTPSATGVSVLTKDVASEYDLTGYKVYVGKYDICRISKHTGKAFVKGEIVSVENNLGLTKPVVSKDDEIVREFYICSKDGSLDNILSVGDYVRCNYPLTGDWAEIDNAISGFGDSVEAGTWYSQVLKDAKPVGAGTNNSFAYTTHPRTVVGFKEDGSTVLFVCDGRGKPSDYEVGMSYFQLGEAMRLAGCVNAFNLDGGGSSTLIVRNSYGEFDVVNRPSDGSERSIGNAILFVMRDPGISWDIQNTTRSEVIFTKENSEYANEIKNVKVEIDGKVAEMKDGKAIVSGLKENSTYIATVSYEAPSTNNDGTMVNGSYKVEVRTKAFEIPNSGISFTDINKTSVKAIKNETDYEIKNVKISMNGTEYQMGSVSEYVLTDLIGETEYNIVIEYTVVDYETGNEYQGVETYKLTTLAFELPIISEFRVYKEYTDKIKLKYAYVDKDSVVKKVEIQYNESSLEVTGKQGYPELTNLDLENEKYEITLVLTYVNGKFAEVVESEKIVIGKGAEEIITHNINYVLDGGILPENTDRTYQEKVGLSVLPTPTRKGYEFTGWYNEKGEKVTSISVDETTDITLTAHWERESKKGCKCGADTSIRYILSLTTLLASSLVILRKKK